jgi:surfeit locus 1 family protein
MNPKLRAPAIMTLAMLAILIGLGVWQLQRREWKRGVLDHIDTAERSAAMAMPDAPEDFQKVRLEGHPRVDLESFYAFEIRNGQPGGHLIVPYERHGKPTVLVDLGFVPESAPHPFPVDDRAVEGFVRPAEQAGAFSGKDDPAHRHFYTLDPALIGKSLGLSNVAAYTIVALAPAAAGQIPEPSHAMPRPPNDHLGYALTWFGFAATLLIIFFLYARKSQRS